MNVYDMFNSSWIMVMIINQQASLGGPTPKHVCSASLGISPKKMEKKGSIYHHCSTIVLSIATMAIGQKSGSLFTTSYRQGSRYDTCHGYSKVLINGKSRILKWSYCTTEGHILGIFPYIALQKKALSNG